MIKLNSMLTILLLGIVSILKSQDSIPPNLEPKQHYFEGYVYLISQDVLGIPDAYTVSNSINLIGEFVLLGKTNKSRGTHFDYWFYTVEPSNPEESVPNMAEKAGLLWNTNDLASEAYMQGIGVMTIRQQLFEDKLSLQAGKMFPGVHYQSNYYAPNNSETHMNSMLTGNPASTWFASLGLGFLAEYNADKWFAKLGIHDATADAEIDFKSLSDGNFLYISELGLKNQKNQVSVLYSYVDDLPNKTAEHGISLGGVCYFGADQLWGAYGRYSFRNGGVGRDSSSVSEENVLINGGFMGISKTAPWNLKKAEIGGTYFIGKPSNYQINLGMQTQSGIEAYFKWSFRELLHAALDFQLIHTGNSFAPIIGARFKAGWSTLF